MCEWVGRHASGKLMNLKRCEIQKVDTYVRAAQRTIVSSLASGTNKQTNMRESTLAIDEELKMLKTTH